jgi:spermidine synthase
MFRPGWLRPAALLLFFLSGAAGLGYQMVWAKMLAEGLGHEIPAVLAVVAAFLGGMALGAWSLDGLIARARRPGLWYGALEITIGLWGFLSARFIPDLNRSMPSLLGLDPDPGRHWALAFGLPFLILSPATLALGATFPAMERFLAPLMYRERSVGAVYSANTLGAVAGTLAAAFFLAPAVGFRHSLWALAAINLFCGLLAGAVQRKAGPFAYAVRKTDELRARSRRVESASLEKGPDAGSADGPSVFRLRATVFVTGLLGIGYELVGIRVLSQVLENTVYTFASVLSFFLLGTALGAALYQRFGGRTSAGAQLSTLLGALALCSMGELFVLARIPSLYPSCRASWGDGSTAVMASEMAAAAAVFFVPTCLMGATFSHLVQTSQRRRSGVGRAASLNLVGGALAGAVFNVVLLPVLGTKWTLVLVAAGYLPLAVSLRAVRGWRRVWLVLPCLLIPVLPSDLRIIDLPPDGRLVAYREGVMASVAVLEDARHDRSLRVNNRFQMGGTAAASAEYRHALIPLLLHPHPRRVLFLGLGTGISLGGATFDPAIKGDGVELVPEVLQVMPLFQPQNRDVTQNPRIRLRAADARRFVRATTNRYDVIVADLFHPARDGAGSLYTLEHFRSIRDRLAAGGLFCQWLPLHQMDASTLRIIVRTFLEVYPAGQAWLLRFNVDAPVLGLVGSLSAPSYGENWVEKRLADPGLAEEVSRLALADSIRLFGCYLAGSKALAHWADGAPLNTDDFPRVTFAAPEFTFRKRATSYGRLLSLLDLQTNAPPALFAATAGGSAGEGHATGPVFLERLEAYWRARNIYLRGLVEEDRGRHELALLAYLESARLSEAFTSGYAQCLRIATALASSQPEKARAILEQLDQIQPSRPIARQMLERLFGK